MQTAKEEAFFDRACGRMTGNSLQGVGKSQGRCAKFDEWVWGKRHELPRGARKQFWHILRPQNASGIENVIFFGPW